MNDRVYDYDSDSFRTWNADKEKLFEILNDYPIEGFKNIELANIATLLFEYLVYSDKRYADIVHELIKRISEKPTYIREPRKFEYKYSIGEIVERKREFLYGKNRQTGERWETVVIIGYGHSTRYPHYSIRPIDAPNLSRDYSVHENDLRVPVNPSID